MTKLLLASASPRRRQILSDAGFLFDVIPSKVSEIPDKNLTPEQQILDIARRKSVAAAQAYLQTQTDKNIVILSADTEVVFKGQLLGKPKDFAEAQLTLKNLSGQKHEVITGLVFYELNSDQFHSHFETTSIEFHLLSDSQIDEYVQTGDPLDKAGSYGIQHPLAAKFVKEISGDYLNVVGLPLLKVQKVIQEQGWSFKK